MDGRKRKDRFVIQGARAEGIRERAAIRSVCRPESAAIRIHASVSRPRDLWHERRRNQQGAADCVTANGCTQAIGYLFGPDSFFNQLSSPSREMGLPFSGAACSTGDGAGHQGTEEQRCRCGT